MGIVRFFAIVLEWVVGNFWHFFSRPFCRDGYFRSLVFRFLGAVFGVLCLFNVAFVNWSRLPGAGGYTRSVGIRLCDGKESWCTA